jgi:hypothetical protein
MTLAKKGSRALVVRGLNLRYSVLRKGVRGCPDCDRLHVVLSDDSRKGSVVLIHADDPTGPDVPITPGQIAVVASQALDAGWRPGEGKGVFTTVSLRPDGIISPVRA